MHVTVKLFSGLRDCRPDYDPAAGLVVELPDRASVAELVRRLGIPASMSPVVSCGGRILQKDERLENGSLLHLFQPVAGG
jgi:sulfur carrier protein ThiS